VDRIDEGLKAAFKSSCESFGDEGFFACSSGELRISIGFLAIMESVYKNLSLRCILNYNVAAVI
jgi:hypothetical protein